MTLRETERRRLQRMRSAIEDDQTLTFRQWCVVNGVSERTGRRILASGAGPVLTDLGARLIRITVANNRAWQASRART
jgi:hypothetical protein